jgi:hypothetical protein
MIFGVLGGVTALVVATTLIEEQKLFKIFENFFLGFKLRRQNSVKGEGFGYWTTRSINSRLGNKLFSFNVGSDHTLVRLPFEKMALISKGSVIAIGCVGRFEYGKSTRSEGGIVILYQAGPVFSEDSWAAQEFRLLVCQAGKLKDLPLTTVIYQDRAPQVFCQGEDMGIVQYGEFPYKKKFPEIMRLLDLKTMRLASK